jgi:hypothetical protein
MLTDKGTYTVALESANITGEAESRILKLLQIPKLFSALIKPWQAKAQNLQAHSSKSIGSALFSTKVAALP